MDPIKKTIMRILMSLGILLALAGFSYAQTVSIPEFLVTWSANSYVPADYQGKIFPSKSSQVKIGLDLIDKNRIADLSGANISWFLNDTFIRSGIGLKNINLNINRELNQNIRISITDYADDELDHIFVLPVANPEIVIDTKNPLLLSHNQIQLPAKDHLFEARPFFFNISNLNELSFKWRIGNKLVSGEAGSPEFLNLNFEATGGAAKETQLTLSVSAANINNQFEFSSKSYNFLAK